MNDSTTAPAATAVPTPSPTTSTAAGPALDTDGDVPADGDPRATLDRVLDVAVATVRGVSPDQLDRPTPCAEFDVRELLRHLHMAVARAAAVPTIVDPSQLPAGDTTVPDDGWPAAYDRVARVARAAWSDDATLDREMHLPWMSAPGRHVLAVYLNEIIVHTWDLGRATDQAPVWRDADVDVALAAIHRELPVAERGPMWEAAQASLPAEMAAAWPWSDPFADAVDLSPDAPAIDRLVAWCGRRP